MFAAPGEGAAPARRTGSYYSTAARKGAEAEREYARIRDGMPRSDSPEHPCVERAVADNEACMRFFAGAGVGGMRNARKRTQEGGGSGMSAGDCAARAACDVCPDLRDGGFNLNE